MLERFPDLKVALLEGDCSGAPWFMKRLRALCVDGLVRATGAHVAAVAVVQTLLLGLSRGRRDDGAALRRYVRRRKLIFYDVPHGDSKYTHAVDSFDNVPLSDENKAKMVSTNWSALYDTPVAKRT